MAPSLEQLLGNLLSGDETLAEASVAGLVTAADAVVPRLLELQRSAESDHRWWAVRALAAMQPSKAGWFISALEDAAPEVRSAAALAIATHPDATAIGPLIVLLNDEDNVAAVMAVNALVKIGSESVPLLLEAFGRAPRRGQIQILRALAELRDVRAITLMLAAQGEDSAAMQYWAHEGLERLGLNMVYLRPD